MKPQTANSVVISVRCAHRSAGGRRCRLSASDPRSVFCAQHRSEQLEEEAADHFSYLSRNFQYFQTAQGINYSLMNLYQLLAQNRISPRRAAVLSHICGLLLRTLPAIDGDNEDGITDTDEDGDADDSDSDVDSDSHPETTTQTETKAHLDSVNAWDPSQSPTQRRNPHECCLCEEFLLSRHARDQTVTAESALAARLSCSFEREKETTSALEVGVLLILATLSMGTRTLASGK